MSKFTSDFIEELWQKESILEFLNIHLNKNKFTFGIIL